MIDPKPKKHSRYVRNGVERASYTVPITELHKEIRNNLVRHGEHFLTTRQFMDVLGLAFEEADKRQAVDNFISYGKWLHKLRMQMYEMGYILKPDGNLFFTYKLESTRFKHNQSVFAELLYPKRDPNDLVMVTFTEGKIGNVSELDTRIFELVNATASVWISAYEQRPEVDILKASNGL
ncbi:TPA: hypothetical protein QDB06_000877 [Burkholderia vietnamiensis]|nr:hypothetical protein [Burkholderia vietnamiensis]